MPKPARDEPSPIFSRPSQPRANTTKNNAQAQPQITRAAHIQSAQSRSWFLGPPKPRIIRAAKKHHDARARSWRSQITYHLNPILFQPQIIVRLIFEPRRNKKMREPIKYSMRRSVHAARNESSPIFSNLGWAKLSPATTKKKWARPTYSSSHDYRASSA